jgi:4-diphosphocytidyl-2-C-methyl-D-erythritol kinase
MIVYPNGKINIGLNIVEKRTDGFHNIESIFYPVELSDILEINPAEGKKDVYTFTGSDTGCPVEKNLCYKAVNLMRQYCGIPAVNLHLHKQIPHGTGLGGGSSDASFTLIALNQLFDKRLVKEQLLELALQLGSDCPYFIYNKAMLAKGRGDILTPVPLNLDNYTIRLAFPGFNIPTAHAYSKVTPAAPKFSLEEMIKLPVHEWKGKVVNDFEKALASDFQQLERIKVKFYREGAMYSSMTGSGSAVYGIFVK